MLKVNVKMPTFLEYVGSSNKSAFLLMEPAVVWKLSRFRSFEDFLGSVLEMTNPASLPTV